MTLVALICAYQHLASNEGGANEPGLIATLPLVGRTLVERQARLAAAAGAVSVTLFVDRLPAELLAAIERLRAEGLPVNYARTPLEAAQAVAAGDDLLLMADGFIAEEAYFTRLLAEGHGMLTVPDIGIDGQFERIDADSRWAGLALTSGQTLKQAAMMIKDWDLQSTLLRMVVQAGEPARPIKEMASTHLTIVTGAGDLAGLEQQIFDESMSRGDSWVSRYLLAPVEQAAARWLMPTPVTSEMMGILAVVLNGLAAFLFTRDWLWAGGVLMLLSTPMDDIGARLAGIRVQGREESSWPSYLLPATSALALLTLSYALGFAYGWGCLVVAVAALAFVAALWLEVGETEVDGQIFLAERKGMAWLMVPFAVTGSWLAGLFGLSLYAAASFFWAQHQTRRRSAG